MIDLQQHKLCKPILLPSPPAQIFCSPLILHYTSCFKMFTEMKVFSLINNLYRNASCFSISQIINSSVRNITNIDIFVVCLSFYRGIKSHLQINYRDKCLRRKHNLEILLLSLVILCTTVGFCFHYSQIGTQIIKAIHSLNKSKLNDDWIW